MKIKCLIFDMDGLMFDSERIGRVVFKKAASELGYIISDEIHSQLIGGSRRENEERLKVLFGKEIPSKEIYDLTRAYRKEVIEKNGLPIKSGLLDLLEYVKKEKIKTVVASSTDRKIIEWYLSITNTKDYFDYIIGGDEVKKSKPNPEIFQLACEKCDVKVNEALVLEDSKNGILAAASAKIPVICIPDLIQHSDEINALTYKVLPNLTEVIYEIEGERGD